MEWEKIVDKLKDVIVKEIKEEFKDFKATVSGQLSGFAVAIESMNARMNSIKSRINSIELKQSNIESELRDMKRTIDDTNKRIDEFRVELKTEIMMNTQRIDETNKRIDDLFATVSHIRSDLNKALSEKETVNDMRGRIQRLEERVLSAA